MWHLALEQVHEMNENEFLRFYRSYTSYNFDAYDSFMFYYYIDLYIIVNPRKYFIVFFPNFEVKWGKFLIII